MFALPGKNITIYARALVCPTGNDAVLDTSAGADTTFIPPFNPPKADSGRGAGTAARTARPGGAPADDGQAGAAAGSVTINAARSPVVSQ